MPSRLAGVAECDVARLRHVFAQLQGGLGMLEQLRQQGLARFDRLAPQIPSVELEQIEREQNDVLAPTGKADVVACDRLAVDEAGAGTQERDRDGDHRVALAPIEAVSRK